MSKKLRKLFFIMLCMLQIIAIMGFYWIVEITMQPNPEIYLTNGFETRNPIQVYHFWLYASLLFSVIVDIVVLLNLDEITWMN